MSESSAHATDTVSARALWAVMLGTLALVLCSSGAIWLVLQHEKKALPEAVFDTPVSSGPPLLQAHPQTDLVEHTQAATAQLHSAGWVDKQGHIVHLPIEQAMQLLVERGLPEEGTP